MICWRWGFPVHNPLTAKDLHQGQGGVEPGRDGEVDHVQHKVKESGVSGTYLYILLLPVVVKELGDEPRGPSSTWSWRRFVVGTYFGPKGVDGGLKGLLHNVGSKRRFADKWQVKHQEERSQPPIYLYQES